MKRIQDKNNYLGAETSIKSRTSAPTDYIGMSANLGANSLSLSSTPSTSHRSLYVPLSNIPMQGRKNGGIKEVDKADTPKKKNRRRERNHTPKATEGRIITPSPNSSFKLNPSFNKAKPWQNPCPKPLFGINPSNTAGGRKQGSLLKVEQNEGKTVRKSKSRERASTSGSKNIVEIKFRYEISPVDKPLCGKSFRKRSVKHKYINLKTFLGLARTCIFKSNIGRLSAAFKNLALGPKVKQKNRKYFGGIVHNDTQMVDVAKPAALIESRIHSEMVISTTGRDHSGREVTESILVVEDSSLQVEQNADRSKQSGSPKRVRRPKKEKRTRQKFADKETKESQDVFPPYITDEEAKIGVETGEFIRGTIRVNPKNARDSYVSNEDSALPDYYVTSIADRNRALDGDEVLLKLKPEPEWQDGKKTAVVVYILEKVHPRTTVGNLKPCLEDSRYSIFNPRDRRMPLMYIASLHWPKGFKNNPKQFADTLFIATLIEWKEPRYALGIITDKLGTAGDLCVETQAILKEFCLDTTPFSPDMVPQLPKMKDIPVKELEGREDIRKECVFTIDPLTARDLDDAVSVKELPNGHYEIGVHISDASYYLPEGSSLDKVVSSKATTIYLVDSVYHMLPVELCLHCSLLPGEDKLSFSVFWEMDEQGEIYNTRFTRTILNSCTQLAYEHAQQMIEDPTKEFKKGELPPIMNGFTAKDLSRTVNVLQKIAVKLRESRVRNGSLRIDQVKLLFSLHPRNGEPLDFIMYENKESHRLIEEFMLLANISVAKKINEYFPDIAFLRCHEPPKQTMLLEAQRCLESCGILIDVSSSGGIHSSLRKYITDDYQGLCRGIVLNHIFAKPMTRARYFCASTMDSEENYAHYALSVPIYTHFTSPIRRYADIMVHRLLAASLGYADKPQWDIDQVRSIAANCNKQKYNAKRAGEASSDLYLAHYIDKNQPFEQNCVVVDVKDRSFDAIVLKTGTLVRVYPQKCEDNPKWTVERIPIGTAQRATRLEHEKKINRVHIDYPKTKKNPHPQSIIVEMFSVVKVRLKRVPNSYKLESYLLRPIQSRTFERRDIVTPTSNDFIRQKV